MLHEGSHKGVVVIDKCIDELENVHISPPHSVLEYY